MVNGAPREVALMEAGEALEDGFRAMLADGEVTEFEVHAYRKQLRGNVSLLADYAQERAVLRAMDRRGLDSAWAQRVLRGRWASQPTPLRAEGADDPEAA